MSGIVKVGRALNALKHGLTSQAVLIPSEDPSLWDAFEHLFLRELAPVGPVEDFLAHRVAAAAWRLVRVERLEGSLSALKLSEVPELVRDSKGRKEAGWRLPDPAGHHVYDGLGKLARHEAAIERSFFRSLRALDEAQAARREREADPKRPAGFA